MRRVLVLASAVVLVETTLFAALSPLLPELERDLDLSKGEAGLLVAMYAIGALAGAIPGGVVATRVGIRAAAVFGLVLLAAASVGFGIAEPYWLLNAMRFAQGVAGSFCWTGALAWLVSSTPRERRGELIGVAMAFATGGALLGPVLGGAASAVGRGAAFLGFAVVVALLAVIAARLPRPSQEETQPARVLLVALRSRRVLVGMWLLILPAMLFGTLGVLAPLELDALGWGALGVSATFVLSAALEAIASPFVGRWSDRSGRLAPIRVGLVAGAAISLVLPWLPDRWLLSAFVVVAGVSYALFWAPAMALLSDAWEAVGVGHALGFALMNFAWAPGHVLGSGIGGAVADVAGDAGSYSLMAGIALLTAGWLALGRRRLASAPSRAPAG